MAIVAVAIALLGLVAATRLVISLTFDAYVLPSRSMEPTLTPGDRVLARKISGDDVSRGDVVIYAGPVELDEGQEFITRVVAVGGDEVGDDAGFLSVNGGRADESYLAPGTVTPGLKPVKVPDGHVFVMGDNRRNSLDSRVFGSVPDSQVRKLVVIQWWPLSELGGL